jgi:hypothetical protein
MLMPLYASNVPNTTDEQWSMAFEKALSGATLIMFEWRATEQVGL